MSTSAAPASTLPSQTRFNCPQCRQPVYANDTVCPHCGVNLAFVAALAEREVLASMPPSATAPFVGDVILPRFGEFLVQHGDITEAQLQAALSHQHALATRGKSPTVGQVLIEMGIISRSQLEQASIQQVKQLQHALQESNQQLEERVTRRTQELQQALQKLTELNQLKANFVANISHELRTPLVPIKSYTELWLDGTLGPLTEDQQRAAEAMTRSIRRLEDLVNNLIKFAASITGDMMLIQSAQTVSNLMDMTVHASYTKAAKKRIRLTIELPSDLPQVLADGEKVHWVLLQLVDNAIKFTPDGGAVTLTGAAHETTVRLGVRDTGIGIPPERITELFQAFHQLDGSSTRQQGGTGLGLALVKRILDAHVSEPHVESQSGHGSFFWFELPIAIS